MASIWENAISILGEIWIQVVVILLQYSCSNKNLKMSLYTLFKE